MATIFNLPSEIISIIFRYLNYPDIVRFGGTCRRFNELVKSYHLLWKGYYTKLIHPDIVQQRSGCDDWIEYLRKYMTLKNKHEQYIDEMSSVHYSNKEPVDANDCRHFFHIALADESSLGESIYILQQFIRQGYAYLNTQCIESTRPFSLTSVYYAKTVLQYLFQLYLVYQWDKYVRDRESPVKVVNFFVQWADPLNIYPLSEVEAHLQLLINQVKKEILKRYPWILEQDPNLEDPRTLRLLSQGQIIIAISSVIYEQRYINLTADTTLMTLDIVQVIRNRNGCLVAMGAIYQYVAEHFGVKCSLIVLPNHFILELDKRDARGRVYKISLDTGECVPKRRCPFAQEFTPRKTYHYCPAPLILYISNEFLSSMIGVKDWYSDNVESLQKMLDREQGEFAFIDLKLHLENQDVSELQYEINYLKMQPEQLSLLRRFSIVENPRLPSTKRVIVKMRGPELTFAVGMICYHRLYNYVGVIMQWDNTCHRTNYNPVEVSNLQFGIRQPFYHILAMDKSDRYVPQENLLEYNRPTRLFHLEDKIAKSFSHFNGYAYVPNDEKAKEYPEDTSVSNFFKNLHEVRNRVMDQ